MSRAAASAKIPVANDSLRVELRMSNEDAADEPLAVHDRYHWLKDKLTFLLRHQVGVITQLQRHANCCVPIADAVNALNEYSQANPRTDVEEVESVVRRVNRRVQTDFITLRLNRDFEPLNGLDAVNATFGHSAEQLDPTSAPGVMLIADFASYCQALDIESPAEVPYLLHRTSRMAFEAIMRRGLWSPALLRESHARAPWATMLCPISREDVLDHLNVDSLGTIDLLIDVRALIEDAANYVPPVELFYAPGPAFFVPGKIPEHMIVLARLNGRDEFVTPQQLTLQADFRAGVIPDRLPDGGIKGGGKGAGKAGQKGADNLSHPHAAGNALFKRNLCKFFLNRKCTKGAKCEFFHDPADRPDCPYWPGDVVQLWFNEEDAKARRERGRPVVKAAPPALAQGGRSASSRSRGAVSFPPNRRALEEVISGDVKAETDVAMESGDNSPDPFDDNPHSRQTSQESAPPDFGDAGRNTPDKEQRDSLEEQAQEQLKDIVHVPDA